MSIRITAFGQGLHLDTIQTVKYNNFIEELSGMPLLVTTGETEAVRFKVCPITTEVHMPSPKTNTSSRLWSLPFSPVRQTRRLIFFCLLLVGSMAVEAASPNEIELKLQQARSDLLISQATEKRIASELENLRQSGKATPAMLKNYETYLSTVRAMVAENQKIVRGMEEACDRHLRSEKSGGCSKSAPPAEVPAAALSPSEEAGELDPLDRKLNDSLSSFDQILLKEMDDIRLQSESRMKELAQEAASAAGRIGDGGEGSGESGGEGAAAGEPGKPGSGEQGQEEKQKSGKSESGGSYGDVPVTDGPVNGTAAGGGASPGQRAERPSGSTQDDDIVARQLREAAEKETDPELKKKLWKEYEDYKKASR